MVERWMTERASKSFGGSCMSKFVQENEQKRIMRLKNMKSSIVKMSCNKHDNWTRNKVEKRHRALKKRSNFDSENGGDESKSADGHPDFDLCFRPKVDTTKSGLKLRLTNGEVKSTCRDRKIAARREAAKENGENKNHSRLTKGTMVGKASTKKTEHHANEGKENKSPSRDRAPGNSNSSSINEKPCHRPLGKLNIGKTIATKEAKSHTKSSSDTGSDKDKLQYKRKNPTNRKAKDMKNKFGVGKTTNSNKADVVQKRDSRTRQDIEKTKKSQNREVKSYQYKKTRMKSSPSKKRNQLHTNRGVSLEALSKERLEALAILEELDSTPWGSKSIKDTKKKNRDNSLDGSNKLDMNSFSQSTQNMFIKDKSPLMLDEQKFPSSTLSSSKENKSTGNLKTTTLLYDCDELLCEHVSVHDENSRTGDKQSDSDNNNYLDRISDTSSADTSLHNSYYAIKEIEDGRRLVSLRSSLDDIAHIPKDSLSSSSSIKAKSEDSISIENRIEEENGFGSMYSAFPHDDPGKKEYFLSESHSDSSQKSTSVDEVVRKDISKESKLNESSNSECSIIYSDSFEGETNLVEYDINNSKGMKSSESSSSEIRVHDNHDENENDLVPDDEIGITIEKDQGVDWTPQFEAESFFVPIE